MVEGLAALRDAGPERRREYARRADAMASQVRGAASRLLSSLPAGGGLEVLIKEPAGIALTVASYYESVLSLKLEHGQNPETRIETEISAGLMFHALVQDPPFGFEKIGATAENIESFRRLSNNLAFLVALGIFRGHHDRCSEETLKDRIHPLADYMVRHGQEICASGAAGAVAVFTALACLDRALEVL